MATASEIGPAPSDSDLSQLIDEVKDYQLTHGALLKLVRCEEATTVTARPVGASLLPSPFPRAAFQHALELQPAFNQFYINAVADATWLFEGVLQPLLAQDELLAALWGIHVDVVKAGGEQQQQQQQQDVCCGIFRSDYMLHHADSLKQVEMNTIAVTGACHAERVAGMHRHLSRVRDVQNPKYKRTQHLPHCNNISGLVETLKAAHGIYEQTIPGQTCIVMVVQPDNFKVADERPIEYALWNSNVPCFRCEWQAVLDQTLCANDGTLLFCPPSSKEAFEVSVIYYRAGFEPDEYDSHGREIRVRLEASRAIKCPDILTHLMTFKAVQHALTQFNNVDRFAPREMCTEIRDTFMQTYNMDDPEARRIATNPELAAEYVLTSNRVDGGGHDVRGLEIPDFLTSTPEDQWRNHRLMRAIRPPGDKRGTLMTPEGLYTGPVISELGVLGGCIWRRVKNGAPHVLKNETVGWTFRSTPQVDDKMSISKGFACFDCPILTA